MPMDSMNASLRLMRSSRSISYWDLGATGMFDGILIDERGAVCGEKCACAVAWAVAMSYTGRRARAVPASRRFLGWRQQPDSVLRVHGAQMRGFRRSGRVHGCEVLSFFSHTVLVRLREDLSSQKRLLSGAPRELVAL